MIAAAAGTTATRSQRHPEPGSRAYTARAPAVAYPNIRISDSSRGAIWAISPLD
jgi:hypothetical protein